MSYHQNDPDVRAIEERNELRLGAGLPPVPVLKELRKLREVRDQRAFNKYFELRKPALQHLWEVPGISRLGLYQIVRSQVFRAYSLEIGHEPSWL